MDEAEYRRQIEVYNEQTARTNAQLDRADAHLDLTEKHIGRALEQEKRMVGLLEKWEEQAVRQDAILDGVELLLEKASE